MPGLKRFLLKVVMFAPLLAVVVIVNYRVDPADVFHAGEYEASVVEVLLNGANVDHYRTGDERLVDKLYIARMPRPHDVVALGSSRLMQLMGGLFPGRSFFNHSVSGATVRDMVVLHGLLRKRDSGASTVVLGLDPWSFSPRSEDALVHSMWQEYREAAAVLGLSDSLSRPPVAIAELAELLSLSSFQSSLAQLVAARRQVVRTVASATQLEDGVSAVRRADGSLSYALAYRLRSVEVARQDAETFVRTSPYASIAFQNPDPALVHIFEALLAQLVREGASVTLWRSPLHPLSYRTFAADAEKRRGMGQYERLCQQFERTYHVTLAGSFDPANYGLTDDDFYDGLHPKSSAMARLVPPAWARPAEGHGP